MPLPENIKEVIGGEDLISIASYFLDNPVSLNDHPQDSPEFFEDAADVFKTVIHEKLTRAAALADIDFALVILLRDCFYDMLIMKDEIKKDGVTVLNSSGKKASHPLLKDIRATRAQFYKYLTAVGATPMSRKNKNLLEPPPATAGKHGNSKSTKLFKILGK